MAELIFKVKADYDEAIACRNEVRRLEAELKALEAASDINGMERVSSQLVDAKRKLNDMCDGAAKAAAVMGNQFRQSLEAANADVAKYQQNMYVTKQRIEQLTFDILSLRSKLASAPAGDKGAIKLNLVDKSASLKLEKQALEDLSFGLVTAQQKVADLQAEQKLFANGIATNSNTSVSALKSVASASAYTAQRIGEDLPSATEAVSLAFQRLKGDAMSISGMLMGGLGIEQFIGNMIQTRGEFQQTEMAFDTMLGDAQKSQQLVSQLINTAAKTPFDMQGITNGAKQLLAYGTSADEVNQILVRLGDIAAGLSLPLNDLVYLYGTTMTQGRMYTQDLRQFMGRGIPMADELAKQFGVTKDEVGELVTKGKVGAAEVKKAIESMTDTGGRFGGLMEKQSATFVGKISNIEDAVSQMFNEMGKSQEGVINDGIDLVGKLVDNWQVVGKVILTAIAAVGTYKASLIATAGIRNAQEKAATSYFDDSIEQMGKAKKNSLKQSYDLHGGKSAYRDSVLQDIQRQTSLKTSDDGKTVSLQIDEERLKQTLETAKAEGLISEELEKEILRKKELLEASVEETRQSQLRTEQEKFKQVDSQYTNVTEELSTVTTALENAKANKEEAESIIERNESRIEELKTIMESADASADSANASSMADEIATLAQENSTMAEQRDTAETDINTLSEKQNTLTTQQGALADQRAAIQQNMETVSVKGNTLAKQTNTVTTKSNTLAEKLNAISTKASATAQKMLSAAVLEVKGAFNGLKAALMTNPITAIATVAMTAVTALSMFTDEEEDAAEMSKEFGDSASETINKVNSLYSIIQNTEASTKVHKDALSDLSQIYEDYGIVLDKTAVNMGINKEKHDELTQAIINESVERQKANAIQTAADNYNNSKEELWKGVQDSIGGDNANVITATIRAIIPDEDLLKLGQLNQGLKDGTVTLGEYSKASGEINNKVEKLGRQFGLSEQDIFHMANSVTNLSTEMYALDEIYNQNISTINKASDAVTDWDNKTQKSAYTNKLMKMSIEDLTSATESLIREWENTYHLNLKIHYDDSEIPAWMKNMTDEQLKNLIARRTADVKQQEQHKRKTGRNLVTHSGGKVRSLAENQTDVAMANSILEDRDKAKKEKEAQEAEKKKNKDKNKTSGKKNDNTRENAQKKNADDLLKLQQKNQDDELALQKEGTEKKLAQIRNDYAKRKVEIDKQEKAFKDNNKKAGAKTGNNGLTTAQTTALTTARTNALQKYNKDVGEARKEELQSMREYLSKYGSLSQQRTALEEDYNEKIKNAKNDGERMSLQKEKEEKLANFSYQSISQGIDWKSLLGGVANLSKDMLKPMLEQLDAYSKSDEYKQADIDTQQKTVDLIKELRTYTNTDDSATWQDLAAAIEEFQSAVNTFNEAVEDEKNAITREKQAKQALADGKITQDEYDRIAKEAAEAGAKAAEARKDMQNKGQKVNDTTDEVKNQASALTTALQNSGVWKNVSGMQGVTDASQNIDSLKGALDSVLPQMGEGIGSTVSSAMGGMMSSLGGGLSSIMSSGVMQMVGVFAMIPQMILQLADSIKSMVTGILDSFTELLKFEWLSDLINSILSAVTNLIDTILDLPENLFHLIESILVDGIGGLINSVLGRLGNILSFGLLSSGGPADWFTNSNAKEVEETTTKLTESNDRLKDAVEALKDEMSKQSGAKAIGTAKQALEDQKQIIEQQKQILQTQMNYHGSHHSNDWYWDWSSAQAKETNDILAMYKQKNPTAKTTIDRVGTGNSSLDDFYKLTPEQLAYIRTYQTELWYDLTHQGKYDKSEYWENLADLAGSLDEITDSLKETLTSTSFDNLRSNFVSELMDMSKSAADFSDNFSEMLMQSVLNAKISDLMEDELKVFYDKWANYAESGDALTEDEINDLQSDWQRYVQKGLILRDEAAEITGYNVSSGSQKTSSSGTDSITNEQANELNGRFTALQIAGEKIAANTSSFAATIYSVGENMENTVNLAARISNTVDEARNILANMYLEVRGINDNTTAIAKYSKTMNENLEKIKDNTKNI